jgi:ribose transport system substrate-binding protein
MKRICKLSVLLLLLLAGCDRQRSDKLKIALVMKSLANEFFLTMARGAAEHQRAHAAEYHLINDGIKDELDVMRQIELVEQLVNQKVDAIVIAPADSKSLVSACKKAMDEGIVVINIDNKFDPAVLADKKVKIPFVGPDNRKGARLAGQYLATRLKSGDQVAIIEGAPNTFNGNQRKLGFEDAMKAANIQIVSSQSAYWETDKANQVASAVLGEHPAMRAFLCSNDSMALGALAATRAAGKSRQVLIVGFDNISAVGSLISKGEILCSVDQHADKLAVFGIEYALSILRNQDVPQDRETQVDLITADTLK